METKAYSIKESQPIHSLNEMLKKKSLANPQLRG